MTPEAILAASDADLERVTAHGILKERFAGKLRYCARIALETCGGNVAAAIVANPRAASKILRKFPGIAAPGADKVMLLSGHGQLLAPESNGLRVLERLGIIASESFYARSYAAANRAADGAMRDPVAAHLVLHRHGQDPVQAQPPEMRRLPACRIVPLSTYR